MRKKEYASPETALVLLDADVLQTQEGVGGNPSFTSEIRAKGTDRWETDAGDGCGW